jgi:hypothetical protein
VTTKTHSIDDSQASICPRNQSDHPRECRQPSGKAAARAAEAQAAYVRAVTARDAPPSASSDEAEDLYNASPYVTIKCEYGYIQSTAGLYIDISKSRPPGVPKNILEISVNNFRSEWAALKAAARGEDDHQGNGGGDILVSEGSWDGHRGGGGADERAA